MLLLPAYGRSYETAEQVIQDWQSNKDFRVHGGPYVNRRDWIKYTHRLDSVTFVRSGLVVNLETGLLP